MSNGSVTWIWLLDEFYSNIPSPFKPFIWQGFLVQVKALKYVQSLRILLHYISEKKKILLLFSWTKFNWTCFCQAAKISHWDTSVSSLRTCPQNRVWNLPQLEDLLHFRLKYWGQLRPEHLEGLHSHWCCSQEVSCIGNGIFTSIQLPPPSGPTKFSARYKHHKHFWKEWHLLL